MNVPDAVRYFPSDHSIEQVMERFDIPDYRAENYVRKLVKNGQVLIDIDDTRYIKSGEAYLPCARHKNKNIFIVKSVLTWDMVDYRIQNTIKKYHGEVIPLARVAPQ